MRSLLVELWVHSLSLRARCTLAGKGGSWSGYVLAACRLARLSALERYYDRVDGCTQFWRAADGKRENEPADQEDAIEVSKAKHP
jgi:hypothetical protein